jgi:hypothetical protein
MLTTSLHIDWDYFAPPELDRDNQRGGYKHSAPNGAEATDFLIT